MPKEKAIKWPAEFIKAIPVLNRKMKIHQDLPPYDKRRVITTMLQIVSLLYIRVGKEQYAKENKSYGITSLKKKHVRIEGEIIKFNFKAKSHQRVSYTLKNSIIKNHLKLLFKLEGDKMFQYINDRGLIMRVTDLDLNQYIQKYMGKEFTAKDFRTYAANYNFIKSLLHETQRRKPKNDKIIKKNILNARKSTAKYLRHTMAISKKSYIMNFAIELYQTKPEYFINNKDQDPILILLDILHRYKTKILKL